MRVFIGRRCELIDKAQQEGMTPEESMRELYTEIVYTKGLPASTEVKVESTHTKYEWISNMKKLFENWNNYLNERGNPSERRFREAVVNFVVGQMNNGMNAGEASDRARIQKEVLNIVDLAMEQLGLAKKVFQ